MYSLVRLVPPTPPSPGSPAVVAAFDVDGTLTTRDCVTPFLRRVAGRRLATTLLGHPVALAEALLHRDRDRLKEIACSALRGLDAEEVDRLGASFAQEVASDLLRDDTTARLRRHRELGHTVVLASASLDPYLVPLGELLGVDAVVCTRARARRRRTAHGRARGGNCRGPEKARRVREWLDGAGLAERGALGVRRLPGGRGAPRRRRSPVRVDGMRIGPEPR